MSEEFGETIAAAYAAEGPTVDLGRGVHEGALAPDAVVQIPLRMMNRHAYALYKFAQNCVIVAARPQARLGRPPPNGGDV